MERGCDTDGELRNTLRIPVKGMPNGPLEEDAMDLRRLLRLLRAGWITVVIAMVAGCALGGLAYTRTTPRYSAEATLLFSLRSSQSLSALSEGNVYMQAMIPTKDLQIAGNTESNFRNDLILAWSNTY